MKKNIAVLAGDGIGPEVMIEALKVLQAIAERFGHEFVFNEALVGGAAWDNFFDHFPKQTLEVCENSDAILFGSVGGPVNHQNEEKWQDCIRNSILALRKHFNFTINLRPVKVYKCLHEISLLKNEIMEQKIDIMCVRELSQDVYFGDRKISGDAGSRHAYDVMLYDEEVIEYIAREAFKIAMGRRKRVSSIDKENVLACSVLWRDVVNRVAKEFPECACEHILVDNCAMQLIKRPFDFDVLLMPNMFGDILSDEASVLSGSLGLSPSASINNDGFGLYEPSGGSAPDIAGEGIANPIAQILSAAMMLKYSFNLNDEHDAILAAVEKTLADGYRTKDITNGSFVSTEVMGDVIAKNI